MYMKKKGAQGQVRNHLIDLTPNLNLKLLIEPQVSVFLHYKYIGYDLIIIKGNSFK